MLESLKEERLKKYSVLRETEERLCLLNACKPIDVELKGKAPPDDILDQLRHHIKTLTDLRQDRTAKFASFSDNFRQKFELLGLKEARTELEMELLNNSLETLVITDETLEETVAIIKSLEADIAANKVECETLSHKIEHLSQTLKIATTSVELNDINKSNLATRSLLEHQYKTLMQEKKKHMKVFIEKAQLDLDQIWEFCFVDDSEKSSFYLTLESHIKESDVVLELYESHVKHWQRFCDKNRDVLNKVHEWFELWRDRFHLEVNCNDPSRLGDFRALRDEERRRNKVNKRLPKLTQEIGNLMAKTEIMIGGKPWPQVCKDQERRHDFDVQKAKEKLKIASKKNNSTLSLSRKNSKASANDSRNKVFKMLLSPAIHCSSKI